ncbi:MAG: branched-chain amino acid ABC transporter permease [Burkholderiales bacterium]|nr:branched-chain amino acid ABC transporter permease [Burkholderiales bacterium]
MEALPQLIASAIILGGIYALVSIGLTLVFGVMRIVNFAHGEFLMLSMYLAIGLFATAGIDPYVGLLVAVPASLVFGSLIYYVVIRPVVARSHAVQIFTTLGLSIVLQNAALFLWTGNFRQLRLPYGGNVITIAGAAVTVAQVIAFATAAAFTAALFAWLRFTYLGKAMRATAQDRNAATLMGIDTGRVLLVAFLVGTLCVAVAGMLMAPLFATYPTVGLQFVLIAFVVVVLGGLGSVVGALLGAMIVAFIDVVGGFYVGTAWKEVLYFVVFMAVLLARPAGLFGQRGAEHLGT